MTIEEVRAMKRNLESSINKQLSDFTSQTGLSVDDIQMTKHEIWQGIDGQGGKYDVREIRLWVRL